MTEQENAVSALHAIVDGRVQGVGFRMFVQRTAAALDLTGWVRNKDDGRVEVWAEGPLQDNLKLLDALRKGPSSSFVQNVSTWWEQPTGKYTRFSVAPTD